MSKYSAGVYSTRPAEWAPDRSASLQSEVDGWAAPHEAVAADGWAVVETYTVVHGRDGARTGIVIGRLEADGRRFIARGSDADPVLTELLATAPEPVGERVYVRSSEAGNQVTATGPGGRS
jgi:acetyl-CoA C-acetyltransferase